MPLASRFMSAVTLRRGSCVLPVNMGLAIALAGTWAGAFSFPTTVLAQTSREVVQPLPAAGSADLNTALQRLSRNSRDVTALIDAGKASLQLGDIDAAIGFFGRADELSPQNPAVKQGLAAAFVRSERPIQALRLFAEAEAAGARSTSLAADRGLAYDLVGANANAQEQYGLALARKRDPEITRRLALSHAIAGDRKAFDSTLRAQLNRRDYAAYRTRAFGLAILGEDDEAVAIADAVMPKELASQITPYLRFMPRLSAAQQAAAANLGIFPRAAQIGRDDPQIAAYRAELQGGTRIADAGSALAPTGRPLGPRASDDKKSGRRRPGQKAPLVPAKTKPEVVKPAPSRPKVAQATAAPDTAPDTAPKSPVVSVSESPAVAKAELPPAKPVETAPVRTPAPATGPVPQAAPTRVAAQAVEDKQPASVQAVPVKTVTTPSVPSARPSVDLAQNGGPAVDQSSSSFNLADILGTQTAAAPAAMPAPQPAPEAPPASQQITSSTADAPGTASQPPQTQPETAAEPAPRTSVADAFAGLAATKTPVAEPVAGAVDITRIAIPREKAAEPDEPAPPPPPEHPSRIWVQVATGQDRDALRFDWRRISRKAADELSEREGFTTPWNATNRLITGPFETMRSARATINALAEVGVDSFAFRSEKGQKINPLP